MNLNHAYGAPPTPEVSAQLLLHALERGVTLFDTAPLYGGGENEKLLGNTLAPHRSNFTLASKAGLYILNGKRVIDGRPQTIQEQMDLSLQRLQTDRLDLIQLHGASEAVMRLGDAIAALETAREKGLARYIGYSGDSQSARYAVECGAFDALQTSISLADQEAITLTLPLAREKNIGVIAKRPLANVAWKTTHQPIKFYHHQYWERLRKLSYDFINDCSFEESVATALRFTLSVPGVHTAIVGTTKPERWDQNAKMIAHGPLSEVEFEAIRERWEDVAPKSWIGQP